MMNFKIPKGKEYKIKYLVFDYNGTTAIDGRIDSELIKRIEKLSDLKTYVITADTYGSVKEELKDSSIEVEIISEESGTMDKLNFVKELGSETVIAFGNGANDCLMLKEASIGVCILGREGAATRTLMNSDLVVTSLDDAIKYIENPKRIIAGLRE